MYDLDLFVIAIYCLIADELYPALCRQYGPPRRAGFEPALSDPECLTREVVGQYLGDAKQEDLYEQMRRQYGTWFPALTDRVAFVRPSANLWQIKAGLHRRLVTLLGGDHAPVQIIETVPVPICTLARRWRRKIFRIESAIAHVARPCSPGSGQALRSSAIPPFWIWRSNRRSRRRRTSPC